MGHRRKPYKQWEVVSPQMMYGAMWENKKGNKKVISFVSTSPKLTREMVAKSFIKIPANIEHNYRYLRHVPGTTAAYLSKIMVGWQRAQKAGVKIVRVSVVPSTTVRQPFTMKEERRIEGLTKEQEEKIIDLVRKYA